MNLFKITIQACFILFSLILWCQDQDTEKSRAIISNLNSSIQVLLNNNDITKGISVLKSQKKACDSLNDEQLCKASLNFTSGYFYQQAALKDSLNRNNYENQAVKFYKKVLDVYPNNKMALTNLIQLSKNSKGDRESINKSTIKRLKELAEDDPSQKANYLVDIGNLYAKDKDTSTACNYYKEAYEFDPFSKRACTAMVDFYVNSGFICILSDNIRQFAQDCQDLDLANYAVKLLEKELHIAFKAEQYDEALESLVLWAYVMADHEWTNPTQVLRLSNNLFPKNVTLQPATSKLKTALDELTNLFQLKTFEDLNKTSLNFWTALSPDINVSKTWKDVTPLQVQIKILIAKGSTMYYSKTYPDSEGFWKRAFDMSEYEYPTLFTKAAIKLAMLYKKQENKGAENHKMAGLIDYLFNAKGSAYHNSDVSMIRKLHITLGSIFYDQIDWEGNDFYNLENARFQLDRALDNNFGTIVNPELRKMLGDVYKKTGEKRNAIGTYTDAVMDYLSRDQINKAEKLYDQIDNDFGISSSEMNTKKLLALKRIMTLRNRSKTYDLSELEDITKINTLLDTISKIEKETTQILNPNFVSEQFFRGLSDLASRLPKNNTRAQQTIYASALNRLNKTSLLANTNDFERITNITNALQKSVNKSQQMETTQIHKKVDLSYRDNQYKFKIFSIPGYNKTLEVPVQLFQLAETIEAHYNTPVPKKNIPKIKLKKGRFVKY